MAIDAQRLRIKRADANASLPSEGFWGRACSGALTFQAVTQAKPRVPRRGVRDNIDGMVLVRYEDRHRLETNVRD